MVDRPDGLKRHLLEPGSEKEAKYLSRLLRREEHEIEWPQWECEPKHASTLIREYGMENGKANDNPMTKGVSEWSSGWEG